MCVRREFGDLDRVGALWVVNYILESAYRCVGDSDEGVDGTVSLDTMLSYLLSLLSSY